MTLNHHCRLLTPKVHSASQSGQPLTLESLDSPKDRLKTFRQSLIKEAKNWPEFPSPHALTIRAADTEKTLPLLSANVMLYGLDSTASDPFVSLAKAELLWDTGAHSAVVVDELLPQKFKDYLAQPEHDC